MGTMVVFTTMPARATIPTPVRMALKGWPVTTKPRSTPPSVSSLADEPCLIEAVELGHQQHEHQEEGQEEGDQYELHGCLLLFISAAERHR